MAETIPTTTVTQLGARVDALLTWAEGRDDKWTAWVVGVPTGGPNGDGKYPLPYSETEDLLVECPALLADMVTGPAATAVAAAEAAQAATSGKMSGLANATDNALVRFDGVTGKLVQNSLATLDDTGILSLPGLYLSKDAVRIDLNRPSGASDPFAGLRVFDNGVNQLKTLAYNFTAQRWQIAASNILTEASAVNVSGISNSTTNTAYVSLLPSDYGVGKPSLMCVKTPTANKWQIALWDGVNSNGTLELAAQNLNITGAVTSGAITASGRLTIVTQPDAIGIDIKGRASDNIGTVRFLNSAGTGVTGNLRFDGDGSGYLQGSGLADLMKWSAAGHFTFTGLVKPGTFTVATLPAASAWPGAVAYVTDCNSNTRAAVAAGGGSTKALVRSDGTSWLIV